MSTEEELELELEFSPLTLFLSQISQFFSLLLSHPLYFSYFLFFSPYLLKLLSFVSPLLGTTFLLILQPFFFPFSHTHQTQLDDQTFPLPQHLDWFNTVFNTPTDIPTNPFPLQLQEPKINKQEAKEENIPTNPFPLQLQEPEINKQEAKKEDIPTNPFPLQLQEPEINKQEAKEEDHDHDIRENGIKMGMNNKKSFLVDCKVFEDDEEKMDLLWEKYEEKEKLVVEEENDEKSCNLKKDLRSLVNLQKEMEEEEEEEETGKICCLQALKFSTGKMRFGMGKKSGLKKISKAFKGLKFLHQLANSGKNKTHS